MTFSNMQPSNFVVYIPLPQPKKKNFPGGRASWGGSQLCDTEALASGWRYISNRLIFRRGTPPPPDCLAVYRVCTNHFSLASPHNVGWHSLFWICVSWELNCASLSQFGYIHRSCLVMKMWKGVCMCMKKTRQDVKSQVSKLNYFDFLCKPML